MTSKKLRLVPLPLAVGALVAPFVIIAVAWLVDVTLAIALLGALAIGAAVARVMMPAKRAFAIRRRVVDVTMLTVLGVLFLFLAFTTPLG